MECYCYILNINAFDTRALCLILFSPDLQVSDPVAVEFSLNTQMFLLSKKSLWLSDGSMGFGQEGDTAFSEGKPTETFRNTKNLKNAEHTPIQEHIFPKP